MRLPHTGLHFPPRENRVPRSGIPLSLLLLLPASALAHGQDMDRPAPPPRSQPDGGGMSAAVRRVERATGGQVLNVEALRVDGRIVHRVKVLAPGGRIMVVMDDPAAQQPAWTPPSFPTRGDNRHRF